MKYAAQIINRKPRSGHFLKGRGRAHERGIALAIALILLGLLLAFTTLSATLLTGEARITEAQYRNTRTFNAGLASLEVMTEKFTALYAVNQNPTAADIANLTSFTPVIKEGSADVYDFTKQTVRELSSGKALVTVTDPPYNGLTARERVFRLQTVVTDNTSKSQVRLIRDVANYQIPIFQFAAFGFDNLDISPGPILYLGGRAHCNRTFFMTRSSAGGSNGPCYFYGPVTAAGEICSNLYPNNVVGDGRRQQVYNGSATVDIISSIVEGQGPDNPSVGTVYDWGQLDDPTVPGPGTSSAGAGPQGYVTARAPKLNLPTENQGFQAVEVLRRARPTDDAVLTGSRLYNGVFARYSTIRILLDDDIAEFPTTTGGTQGPQAWDLAELGDPNHPNFNSFWVALNNNVRIFDPNSGTDNPDTTAATMPGATAATLPAGSGANVAPDVRVLPPQTNLINAQPEYQLNADGTVNTALRKHSYIKIELVNNNDPPNPPTRVDITKHILNLGITAGPIPVPNYNAANAFSPFDNLANLTTGTGGAVDPQTTYAATYPLNDGNSIPRVNNTAANTPENFMPFLSDSATAVFIGEFAKEFGALPTKDITFRDVGTNKTTRMEYFYEPNSILHLQRTYFPYSPTNNVDMTHADPPATSDAATPVAILNPLNGRLTNTGASSNVATDYPAKYKSLIAKPYFRFTDDFRNETYIKDTSQALLPAPFNCFKLKNPLTVATAIPGMSATPLNYIFNDVQTDRRQERFLRRAAVKSFTITFGSGSVSLTNPAAGGGTTIPSGGSVAAGPYTFNLSTMLTTGGNSKPSFWNENDTNARIAYYLRQFVFKPGIPGFYALAWNPASTAAGTANATDVAGDGRIDLDIDDGGMRGVAPSPALTVKAPRAGVIDLNEMTPFGNLDDTVHQADLAKMVYNPSSLTNATLFPHLLPDGATIFSSPGTASVTSVGNLASGTPFTTMLANLRAVEIGTPGRATDPTRTETPDVKGIAEFPKENLTFDWNGDGIIEPPHDPFQNGSTIPENLGNTAATAADAMGYSVESNVCSLIPSSLRVLRDTPTVNTLNTAQTATTSVPVEIRFIEADVASTNKAGSIVYLKQTNAAIDPGASTGFTDGVNSFAVTIPVETLGIYTAAYAGSNFTIPSTSVMVVSGDKFWVRSAVSIVFQHPLATRIYAGAPGAGLVDPTNTTNGNLNLETALGRRLGLTDVNYAFPGHAYMAFTPNTTDPRQAPTANTFVPRIRTIMDQAFPINIYDQREGRHISRRYGFQNIPTAADYYSTNVGTGPQTISQTEWPDWPASGTAANQVTDDDFIMRSLGYKLPMPSPIELERKGILNVVEVDMGNLKRFFRGDFNSYLATIGGGFTSGQPANNPVGDPATPWGGNGIIDISDNGFVVYISDRRGDDNNDGLYDFNDTYGEQDSQDLLDDQTNQLTSGPNKGKPGDGILRRDVDVETQPSTSGLIPNPAGVPAGSPQSGRSGEAPHGSMPINDGFEYFCGNILTTCRRNDTTGTPIAAYNALLPTTVSATTGTFQGLSGTGVSSANGAQNWRMVDSAKTGRVRAFRHVLRVVNGLDIPRWYLPTDGPVQRHFTGMSLVTENPIYIHGNLNSIGVQTAGIGPAPTAATPADPDSNLPAGGPTPSRQFLQTGNKNNGRTPADWGTNAAFPNDFLFHGPLALMSDAMYIYSRNFQDSRNFISPTGYALRPQSRLQRLPIETTVKAAWFTGQPKAGVQTTSTQNDTSNGEWPVAITTAGNTQGGLHNFPRFLENWGQRFNYNGSFIWDFYSHQGNGSWLGVTAPSGDSPQYNAPPRNWGFDVGFSRLGGLPPATPRVVFYKIRGFRQVFLEDNPH